MQRVCPPHSPLLQLLRAVERQDSRRGTVWMAASGRFAGGRTVPAPSGTTLARFFRPKRSRPTDRRHEKRGAQAGKVCSPACDPSRLALVDHPAPGAGGEKLLCGGDHTIGRQREEELLQRPDRRGRNPARVHERHEGDSRQEPPEHTEVDGADPWTFPRAPDGVQGRGGGFKAAIADRRDGSTTRNQHSLQKSSCRFGPQAQPAISKAEASSRLHPSQARRVVMGGRAATRRARSRAFRIQSGART